VALVGTTSAEMPVETHLDFNRWGIFIASRRSCTGHSAADITALDFGDLPWLDRVSADTRMGRHRLLMTSPPDFLSGNVI